MIPLTGIEVNRTNVVRTAAVASGKWQQRCLWAMNDEGPEKQVGFIKQWIKIMLLNNGLLVLTHSKNKCYC